MKIFFIAFILFFIGFLGLYLFASTYEKKIETYEFEDSFFK